MQSIEEQQRPFDWLGKASAALHLSTQPFGLLHHDEDLHPCQESMGLLSWVLAFDGVADKQKGAKLAEGDAYQLARDMQAHLTQPISSKLANTF